MDLTIALLKVSIYLLYVLMEAAPSIDSPHGSRTGNADSDIFDPVLLVPPMITHNCARAKALAQWLLDGIYRNIEPEVWQTGASQHDRAFSIGERKDRVV